MKTALVMLLFLNFGAPAGAGQFPLCMYGINAPAELAAIKKAGFNCFQTYAQEPGKLAALAAGAARLELKMLAAPDKVIVSTYAAAARGWPMLAWYLYDEPEMGKMPAEELERLDRRVKDWDAGQRTAFVVGTGSAAYVYGATADALMVDWYPVPHLGLETVGSHVAITKRGAVWTDRARPRKPVWAVLQAFDWREYPPQLTPPVGRFPTFEEVRFMSYVAIARGASGLFYYTFSHNYGPLTAKPELWAIYERIAAELNELRPALESGVEAAAPAGLGAGLEAKMVAGGGRTFLILLNPAASAAALEPGALKGWRPLFEPKPALADLLPPLPGGTALALPGYRVLILEKI
ncbi:MAG: hypothetical protein WCK76_13690 [Elusimicrobiota bacterium]